MAYDTANPPRCIAQSVGTNGGDLWWYQNTDAVTVVRVDGYITNAQDLGMTAGDVVFYLDTDASPLTVQLFIVSAINANGSADLSDGTAITATDTD